MANLGQRVWLTSVLLSAVALEVVACGNDDDDDREHEAAAGSGASGGEVHVAGQAGVGHLAGTAGQGGLSGLGGLGGLGGEAGANGCTNGLRIEKVVAGAIGDVVSWPAKHRVAVSQRQQGVFIYELATAGEVTLVETIGLKQLGLPESGTVNSIVGYGEGFLAEIATDTVTSAERRIINWQPDADIELVPFPDPMPAWLSISVAEPARGFAAMSPEGIRVATRTGDTWTWSTALAASGRRVVPLALEDGLILVGVQEVGRLEQNPAGGEGGAAAGGMGGQGGAGTDPITFNARLEWWNQEGQSLESHQTVGNPTVAVSTDEGWLIGETNSFWGSYQAAIELLDEAGTLRKLTSVPVISAGDGTDGAVDLALLGERLLVANCESGLLAGPWSTDQVKLTPLPGPWDPSYIGGCSPRHLEVVDHFAVMTSEDRVVFATDCE